MSGIGSSLFVGNLHPDVTEILLYKKFSEIGPVVSIRVCRSKGNGKSLGYAYVNFFKRSDAERALEEMNFDSLLGRPMRLVLSQCDPTPTRYDTGSVFVKNLNEGIDDHSLLCMFSSFGNVVSCKVATDENGMSKGYGIVEFDRKESADNAIEKLDGLLLNSRKISVSKYISREERHNHNDHNFTNIYVKNFASDFDDRQLRELFQKYGNIKSSKIMKEPDGTSKCFGFVDYESPASAKTAIYELNGKCIGGKILYVGRAQKKAERESLKRNKFVPWSEWTTDTQLYVKNLRPNISSSKLRMMFEEFGTVISAIVLTDQDGNSRKFGFVSFLESHEAQKAMASMNGSTVEGSSLSVSMAVPNGSKNNMNPDSTGIDTFDGKYVPMYGDRL